MKRCGFTGSCFIVVLLMSTASVLGVVLVHQPGSEGKDSYVDSRINAVDENYGTSTHINIGHNDSSTSNIIRALIQFDLSGLPADNISSVKLKLYKYGGLGTLANCDVHRILDPWDEDTVTWNTRPSYNTTRAARTDVDTSVGWFEWDITSLYLDWKAGTVSNYGVCLLAYPVNGEGFNFWSSDYEAEPWLRPILEITCVFPGNGTQEDPHEVSTPEQLNVIGLNTNLLDKHFVLTADIDLSAYTGSTFNIIGNDSNAFTGVFDGNGHTISNFTYSSTGTDYIGLFGYIDPNGEVYDVRLIDPNVDANTGDYVGSLAGRNDGVIELCSVSGIVSGNVDVGVLAGTNTGTILNCYTGSSVSGNDNVGGLAGYNSGEVENCYSTATPPDAAVSIIPTKMYWTETWTIKIQRANLDGNDVEDLVTTGLSYPSDIAIDSVAGKMYWVDYGINKIQRANLDGTVIEDLVTSGLDTPRGIALDVAAGKMYWTDPGTDKIQRANLDGTGVEDLVTSGLDYPRGIALDVTASKMYWTDEGADKIQRANLDGTGVEDLVTTGLDGPDGIALDTAAGKMYWIDWGTDKIQRANLDGSNIEDLVTTGLDVPVDIALDTTNGKMYWTDLLANKIQRANLDGTDAEDLVTLGSNRPKGIDLGTSAVSTNIGGLIGFDDAGKYSGCFWDTDTSDAATSAGGSGKTTAQMKTVSTFFDAGWDLISVWNIEEDQTYPLLRKYSAVDTNYDNMTDLLDFAAFANSWLEGVE